MSAEQLRFDTAQIGPLREVLKRISGLHPSIEDFVRFRVVVDANFVVQELIQRTRFPERGATAFEELVRATVMDVFAPRWLDTEMPSAIHQAAAKRRLPEVQLWTHWLQFRSLLKWDDTLSEVRPSAKCCDPKDVPYVALESKLGADGILSKDAHIARLGGHPLTLDFVFSVRSYARAAIATVSIRVLGTLLPTAALMALCDGVHRTAKAFLALPNPVKALMILASIGLLAHPNSRSWIIDRCSEISTALSPVGLALAECVSHLAAMNREAQSQAATHLGAAVKTVRPRRIAPPNASRAHRPRARALALSALTHACPVAQRT